MYLLVLASKSWKTYDNWLIIKITTLSYLLVNKPFCITEKDKFLLFKQSIIKLTIERSQIRHCTNL